MLCPVCKTGLVLSERQGIEIDYCPQCRGVWLDRSELDRIIERSAASLAPRQESYEQRREYDDSRKRSEYDKYSESGKHVEHGRHYRKKSLLGELFDF